jgi:transcriptional regulator with XRE-family HTH domain
LSKKIVPTCAYDSEKFLADLAARIKQLRLERGWTQMQMARDFGYYLSHWQNIESGRKMSLETMLRVANTFDIDLNELIGGIKRQKGIGFGSKGYYLQGLSPGESNHKRNK